MTVTNITRPAPIGGSEIAAACGIDPHRSRVMLWLEKTGRVRREPSEAMEWGTRLEPVIFEALADQGYNVASAGGVAWRDEARPWLIGHPDGFEWPGDSRQDGPERLLEIKTAGQWAHRGFEGVPFEYQAQVQLYLHLTGLSRALVAILVGGQRLELHELDRDERAIRGLLGLAERFWRHVETNEPPAPDSSESSREAMRTLWPEHEPGKAVRLLGSSWECYRELRRRRAQRDVLDRQIGTLENTLKATMGDAERAIGPHDEDALTWRTTEAKRIDVTALRRDRPEIAAEYETATPTRRFVVL